MAAPGPLQWGGQGGAECCMRVATNFGEFAHGNVFFYCIFIFLAALIFTDKVAVVEEVFRAFT